MKSSNSADAEVAPNSRFFRYLFVGAIVFVLLAIGLVFAAKWAGSKIVDGGHSLSREIHTIIVSGAMLQVPENMIRRRASRRNGARDTLDLYMSWPELEGYSEENRAAFNHLEESHRLIFFSFEPRLISRDMSGRYDLVYRKLLSPVPADGPAGLTVYRFDDASGFENEQLYVGVRPGQPPFVARCLAEEAAPDAVAPCERDVHLSQDISLFYRFPRRLLPEWKALDERVQQKALALMGSGQ